MKTQENASLHRFHNLVAVSFTDTNTLYLTPELAQKLSDQLAIYAKDCNTTRFVNSQLNTVEITNVRIPEGYPVGF